MINLFIANTDNNWFDFLSSEPSPSEVNFWQPSGKGFHAIQAGELLVFRLKSPRNLIGGFGVLSNSSVLPLQTAWDTFGRSNGVPSFAALRDAIAKFRPGEKVGPTTNIGCRILVEPMFFPPNVRINLPPSWSPNIMGGKRFSADDGEGLHLWQQLMEAVQHASAEAIPGLAEAATRYGTPTLIRPRLGQGAFRIAVIETYARQCAITDAKVLPALDAAHIRPYAEGGLHVKSNGILLRKDIHGVFDAGYATVDQDYRLVVSSKVKDVFDNGNEYRRLHGQKLRLPARRDDWPSLEFLRWHNETFVG
jgi:putative restriction endonuclease